jgi:hypothetical protein
MGTRMFILHMNSMYNLLDWTLEFPSIYEVCIQLSQDPLHGQTGRLEHAWAEVGGLTVSWPCLSQCFHCVELPRPRMEYLGNRTRMTAQDTLCCCAPSLPAGACLFLVLKTFWWPLFLSIQFGANPRSTHLHMWLQFLDVLAEKGDLDKSSFF